MWTTTQLLQDLRGCAAVTTGAWQVEQVTDTSDTILITCVEQGDLEVHLTVCGAQILASVLLWPTRLVHDSAKLNATLLRDHKILPLSTFGITYALDEDWYELFGALSADATLQNVLTELTTLAENALEVTEAYADQLS